MKTNETPECAENRLKILHRDADLVAIDKPAGMLVHRSALDKQATDFALQILRDQIQQTVYPCHRLDRATSGILLFALNQTAHRKVQQAFAQQGIVEKTYHAVVRGWLEGAGVIDYDLRNEDKPDKVQSAVTAYRSLQQSTVELPVGRYPSARFTLVELSPKTGRTHQLRRHMAHLRHPIIGDTRHGDSAQNRFLRTHYGKQLLLLRAVRLRLPHPLSGEPLDICAERNEDFVQALDRLKLSTV